MSTKLKTQERKDTGSELALLKEFEGYVSSISTVRIRKDRVFSQSVRASFSKCYEFNLHAWQEANSDAAFFWVPTLRGVCEDLIVLNYIQGIPANDRELLMTGLIRHELNDGLKTQGEFFAKCRPYQRVLRSTTTPGERKQIIEDIRSVWKRHGWPKMKRGVIPPVRDMAAKGGQDVLVTLYDYLYRLTSRTVHFNIGGLLKTGWGGLPEVTFSPRNFSAYYTQFGRVYGLYMLCAYFELFARILRTDSKTKKLVDRVRSEVVGVPRWPEIITFEEVNLEPPQYGVLEVLAAVIDADRKRLTRLD